MPSARGALGRLGEERAAAHLIAAGYSLVARNWRCALGELDLVALRGGQLVFVEVKTRRGEAWNPEEGVGAAKAARLVALAYAYLEATGAAPATPWRIDVIAVELDAAGRVARLEQIEHAVGE
ncbi:MAG TPA: YraN family protein [Chloroflexaceae bacterium]|nr:YraN family protein [Chloroflexaceae bacterium]